MRGPPYPKFAGATGESDHRRRGNWPAMGQGLLAKKTCDTEAAADSAVLRCRNGSEIDRESRSASAARSGESARFTGRQWVKVSPLKSADGATKSESGL